MQIATFFQIYFVISIHAPVWGATDSGNPFVARTTISIHAPVWGATAQQNLCKSLEKLFQFTLPCGERRR